MSRHKLHVYTQPNQIISTWTNAELKLKQKLVFFVDVEEMEKRDKIIWKPEACAISHWAWWKCICICVFVSAILWDERLVQSSGELVEWRSVPGHSSSQIKFSMGHFLLVNNQLGALQRRFLAAFCNSIWKELTRKIYSIIIWCTNVPLYKFSIRALKYCQQCGSIYWGLYIFKKDSWLALIFVALIVASWLSGSHSHKWSHIQALN